jgi:DNA-binding response OmpR family regulator
MASILLSEADPDVRRLLVILLERLGHQPIVLDEGDLESPPPADLMLLEPAAPERLEQARRIRADRPSLPVVCVSVLPVEARFLTLGPLAYLAKPFSFEQLDATIAGALAAAGASAHASAA